MVRELKQAKCCRASKHNIAHDEVIFNLTSIVSVILLALHIMATKLQPSASSCVPDGPPTRRASQPSNSFLNRSDMKSHVPYSGQLQPCLSAEKREAQNSSQLAASCLYDWIKPSHVDCRRFFSSHQLASTTSLESKISTSPAQSFCFCLDNFLNEPDFPHVGHTINSQCLDLLKRELQEICHLALLHCPRSYCC